MRRQFFTLLFIPFFLFTSCVENSGVRTSRQKAPGSKLTNGSGGGSTGPGATEAPTKNESVLDNILESGVAEVRHIVDPFDGTFKKKLTLPKNFSGFLYLSGLNITSLRNRLLKVRFNFGREMESVTIPATVGRAPGLTPAVQIEVLIMDINNRPFENIRLLYDLYDYNDYRDPSTGEETEEPTNDPRDGGLYCRGLKLEHDPTFIGSASNTLCDEVGEKCLYAYAKIVDSGLYKLSDPNDPSSTKVAINPTEPQVDITGNGYALEPDDVKIKKCLPDNFNKLEFADLYSLTIPGSLGMNTAITIGGKSYEYRGPFRAVSPSTWEIKTLTSGSNSAIFMPTQLTTSTYYDKYPSGIFQKSGNGSTDPDTGYGSFLFPRRAKLGLNPGIEYYGSQDDWGDASTDPSPRTSLHSLLAAGETRSMYGCNFRVANQDIYSNEGVGSCNVSANIEILAYEDGQDVVVATSKDVKLQLIRPSLTNAQGAEVLYTSLKSCTTSRTCGSNECCFNDRCWDRNLVGACLEDSPVIGNLQVGEPCGSDYECSSLCCDVRTGRCAVHMNIDGQEVFCSKSPGQTCVAKEWCMKENIPNCYVVKTGTSPTGAQECALRCYNIPTHGNCMNGKCDRPIIPVPPVFNPSNPDCSQAINPPTTIK